MSNFIDRAGIFPVILILACVGLLLFARMAGHSARRPVPAAVSAHATQKYATKDLPYSAMPSPNCRRYDVADTPAGLHLGATGTTAEGQKLDYYEGPNGEFAIMTVGPDKSGIIESCEIARGTNFHPVSDANPYVPATAPSPSPPAGIAALPLANPPAVPPPPATK